MRVDRIPLAAAVVKARAILDYIRVVGAQRHKRGFSADVALEPRVSNFGGLAGGEHASGVDVVVADNREVQQDKGANTLSREG